MCVTGSIMRVYRFFSVYCKATAEQKTYGTGPKKWDYQLRKGEYAKKNYVYRSW